MKTAQETSNVPIIEAVRNEIASGKWCQGKMADADGNHCVLGWWTLMDDPKIHYRDKVKRCLSILGLDITLFNDDVTTTKEMMVSFLDQKIVEYTP